MTAPEPPPSGAVNWPAEAPTAPVATTIAAQVAKRTRFMMGAPPQGLRRALRAARNDGAHRMSIELAVRCAVPRHGHRNKSPARRVRFPYQRRRSVKWARLFETSSFGPFARPTAASPLAAQNAGAGSSTGSWQNRGQGRLPRRGPRLTPPRLRPRDGGRRRRDGWRPGG